MSKHNPWKPQPRFIVRTHYIRTVKKVPVNRPYVIGYHVYDRQAGWRAKGAEEFTSKKAATTECFKLNRSPDGLKYTQEQRDRRNAALKEVRDRLKAEKPALAEMVKDLDAQHIVIVQPDNLKKLRNLHPHTIIRAFKASNENGASPYNPERQPILTCAPGALLSVPGTDTDDNTECGAGVNLATLSWCISHHPYVKYNGECSKIWLVEFRVKDIGAIPHNTDGKFRVFRCRVLEEVDITTAYAVMRKWFFDFKAKYPNTPEGKHEWRRLWYIGYGRSRRRHATKLNVGSLRAIMNILKLTPKEAGVE